LPVRSGEQIHQRRPSGGRRGADVLTNPLLREAVVGRSYAAVPPIGDPGRL